LKVAGYELEQAKAALVPVEDERIDAGRLIEIRSPVTGYVLNVFEESARVVAADTRIMEVGDPRDLEVEVELLSSDAVNVKRGADVSIADGAETCRCAERWCWSNPEPSSRSQLSASRNNASK
jgi:HlyD family secretion protein